MPKHLRCHYRPHRRVQWVNECVDPRTGEIISPPSRTEQHHRDSCDINLIVKRMKPHEMQALIERNAAAGMYLDLPDDLDYQSAIQTVMNAEASFLTLPSAVRDRFGHDPALFLQFATNPANLTELRSLGLAASSLPPPVPPPPTQAPNASTSENPTTTATISQP